MNGLYKAELIHARPAWPTVTEVGFETMKWVNWYSRIWLKSRQAVDAVANPSVHDLRHVAATLAIGAGADVKLVQQMLGHKDATETLNTYAALWSDKVD